MSELIEDLRDRIQALEAALREIKDYLGYAKNIDQSSAMMAVDVHSAWKIARAALDKDIRK